MEKGWSLRVHAERSLEEVSQCQYHHCGQFWTDLHNLITMLSAVPHPCFKSAETNDPFFIANSFRFDVFSFAILCRAARHASLSQLTFNNCALDPVQINLISGLTELKRFQNLQIDWNLPGEFMNYHNLLNPQSKLQRLSLKSCGLANEGFFSICSALKNNHFLKVLDLYGNGISDLSKLAEALEANRSLASLSLCGNELRDENLVHLLGVFGKISFPSEGVEEYQKTQSEQVRIKMKVLEKNNAVENVKFDEMIFDEGSGEYFLMKNQMFLQLNLGMNKLSNDHYLRLILSIALKDFKVILTGNPLPAVVRTSLSQAFYDNIII